MSLNLLNLDPTTRNYMLQEVNSDLNNGTLYLSSRLSESGQHDYPTLLKEAIEKHDDNWFADQLRSNDRLNSYELRKTAKGMIEAKVPTNAPETLAEGEFNRFYIRGLCLRASNEGITELQVYRARLSSAPRPESEARIGVFIDAQMLLEDLRKNSGVDTALGVPPGPNSGLSVRILPR